MKKALMLGLFFLALSFQAKSQSVSEVYAVFLYNFTKHVDNPVKTGDYKIAVVGDDKLLKEMQKFNNSKAPSGQIIKIVDASKIEEAAEAKIVFLSGNKSSKIDEIKLLCPSALIVTERPGMTSKGSCINFLQEGNKIGFEISEASCQEQGVKVSSKLHGLAKRG